MHSEAALICITILRLCHYSTRRISHPRYSLYILAKYNQPSIFGPFIIRNILENLIEWFVNLVKCFVMIFFA